MRVDHMCLCFCVSENVACSVASDNEETDVMWVGSTVEDVSVIHTP